MEVPSAARTIISDCLAYILFVFVPLPSTCALQVPYVVGSPGSNECPVGYANIVTTSSCQAAALTLLLEDHSSSDESHIVNVRPKGCFMSGNKAYINPNPGMPSNPLSTTNPICQKAATCTLTDTPVKSCSIV